MKTKTAKLRLRNTSRYHDYEAFILCRTALESIEGSLVPGETLFPIIVKLTNSSHAYCGRGAWTEWEHQGAYSARKAICWRRILVRIGPPSRFPRLAKYPKFDQDDMPEMEFKTYREAMVSVTAHEMGHALGYSGRKEGEMKCEMCAWDALDYYRKNQAEIDREIDEALREAEQRERDARKARMPEQRACQRCEQAKAKLAHWQRKAKLAATKLKYYQRLVVRRERAFARSSWQEFILHEHPDATPTQQADLIKLVDQRRDAIEENAELQAANPPQP